MNQEERDQRRAAMKAKRMAEDQRAGTRFVMRSGEAWLAMQVNVPVEELRVDRSWGEERVSVVRNAVATHAERMLDTLTAVAPALQEYAEDVGPCDHDVGICSCGVRALLAEVEDLLEALPPATVAARVDT